MKKEPKTFTYEYSAIQQEEVKKIRQKYMPKQEDKMAQLQKLDQQAEKPGMITALIVGLSGTLLFGFGLTCTTVWDAYFMEGIIIGVLGLAAMAAALPLSRYITKKQREKIAEQIIELSDELLHS